MLNRQLLRYSKQHTCHVKLKIKIHWNFSRYSAISYELFSMMPPNAESTYKVSITLELSDDIFYSYIIFD